MFERLTRCENILQTTANARTKVRQFRCLPLETNNQNWTLHKVGDTYSVSFGLRRGITKRVPLAVHPLRLQPLMVQ